MRALPLLVVAALALVPRADASDGRLLAAVARGLPRVEAAASASVQQRYDAARDLVEAVRAARPVGADCAPLARAAEAYGGAVVAGAEAVDRLEPAAVPVAAERARAALARVASARGGCRPGGPVRARAAEPPLLEPLDGEAFDGAVRVRAPRGADRAELRADGVLRARVAPLERTLELVVRAPPGPIHRLEVRFTRRGRLVGRAAASDVWLLPPGALAPAARPRVESRPAAAALAAAARRYPGFAAAWVEDYRGGRYASANADAVFPAASTVKLGVLVAGLRRGGDDYDLRALTAWSSNLAANRLLRRVGGPLVVEETLGALGARVSTYTGDYRVGTAHHAGQPPRISARVTSARDLAAILRSLQRAAAGGRVAGLNRHRARVALALLLSSQPVGENVGLVRPFTGARPVAQKNGWLSVARHTAAIVYGRRGPTIVVVLTYADPLDPLRPRRLGAAVVAVARRELRLS